jgi:UDP-N-acetylmuramyl pentapeptide phosphotransferase/UDP-N-acetylglucosamine-1-phosphate transferase
MKAIARFFGAVFTDPLFFRVCMILWGAPFFALGAYAMSTWEPKSGWDWLVAVLIFAMTIFGLCFVIVAIFGNVKAMEKAANFMDGVDILAFIAVLVVGIVAIPITIALRAFRRPEKRW